MSELFSVRRPDGKLATQCNTREHADREIAWQLASGAAGPFTIERFDREPNLDRWGWCYPNRFTGPWPAAKLEEFRQRYSTREPVFDLAEYFGSNVPIICRMARKLGFIRRIDDPASFEQHRGRWTAREEELVNILYDEGVGTSEIPEHHPRTRSAVEARLTATAGTLSTRSSADRFIRRGRKVVHRVLETPRKPPGYLEENGGEDIQPAPNVEIAGD